ncbi:hypothetical protein BUALT_Bualt07G0069500 [Buddleja alternifolia]|uniref:SRR1-like domain-containing protein n=1 Tax=Buddleja alternifolia TaxID=168488 RepID=A0AAV6XA63_9LAMI|nr:hypothetical protein BUALT_Bualt07G0069500 [Buddleja alternifolia]
MEFAKLLERIRKVEFQISTASLGMPSSFAERLGEGEWIHCPGLGLEYTYFAIEYQKSIVAQGVVVDLIGGEKKDGHAFVKVYVEKALISNEKLLRPHEGLIVFLPRAVDWSMGSSQYFRLDLFIFFLALGPLLSQGLLDLSRVKVLSNDRDSLLPFSARLMIREVSLFNILDGDHLSGLNFLLGIVVSSLSPWYSSSTSLSLGPLGPPSSTWSSEVQVLAMVPLYMGSSWSFQTKIGSCATIDLIALDVVASLVVGRAPSHGGASLLDHHQSSLLWSFQQMEPNDLGLKPHVLKLEVLEVKSTLSSKGHYGLRDLRPPCIHNEKAGLSGLAGSDPGRARSMLKHADPRGDLAPSSALRSMGCGSHKSRNGFTSWELTLIAWISAAINKRKLLAHVSTLIRNSIALKGPQVSSALICKFHKHRRCRRRPKLDEIDHVTLEKLDPTSICCKNVATLPQIERSRHSDLWKNLVPPAMASSANLLVPENSNSAEDWTIVLPRRGKKNRTLRKFVIPKQQNEVQLWAPADLETNPERESKLIQKMQICMQKLEKSEFFSSFLNQMQNPDMLNRFIKVLGSEEKMKLVIYGIGSIESFEPPRLQLSLAILMKRKFDWIGEIEVFDPIISLVESNVLTPLGCSVLSLNEQGRRKVLEPTLFFMPHCEAELYDNLLEANWRIDQVNRLIVFGNSFSEYEQHVSVVKSSAVENSRKHILAVRRFTEEFGVSTFSDDSFRAFHGSSWHFFNPVDGVGLHMIKYD